MTDQLPAPTVHQVAAWIPGDPDASEWLAIRRRDRDRVLFLSAMREQERDAADLRAKRTAIRITACTALVLAAIVIATLALT